jgi:predicted secreted Zn-dependent protease
MLSCGMAEIRSMHPVALAASMAVAMALGGASAEAAVKVTVKKASYVIRGKTGSDLLDAMDRHGPKHGLLTRAIAQTRYSVGWSLGWKQDHGGCRVEKSDATLAITYTYPAVEGGVPPALRKRWATFMKGVARHEETHGAIASEMVKAAERAVSRIAIRSDPNCSKARAETKRRADSIYAQYERRQMLFDTKEHGDGGTVEKLILGLAR